MSSRIIRGTAGSKKLNVRSADGAELLDALPAEQIAKLEQRAYDKGFRDGERSGKQAAENVIDETVQRYEKAINELATSYDGVLETLERKTVQLALEISRKIIQREVSLDPDLVAALATVALRRVQSHQAITLRVSRVDYPRLREAVADVNSTVSVVEDGTLDRGDFMIDTAQSHLDGRIISQIETLGRAMLQE